MKKSSSKISAKGDKPSSGSGQIAKPIGTATKKALIFTLALLSFVLIFATKGLAAGVKGCMLFMWGDSGRLSGKAGARVFMKNNRARSYVPPTVVRNDNTGRARGLFSSISSAYRSLTAEEILAWVNFKVPVADRFGNSHTKSGKSAYLSLNANLSNTAQAAITSPPTNLVSESVLLGIMTADVSGNLIKVGFTPTSAGVAKIYATSPQGFGVSKPSASKYRLIGTFDPTGVSPADITGIYTARFGSWAAGQKIFVQVGDVNDGGIESARTAVSCVVTA